jgi:anti-sigma regulatory factor (Ser/Thr protein kinase)
MRETFRRDIHALDDVFGFLRQFRSESDIEGGASYALEVAVEEFFTNIVKYSRGGQGDITIDAVRDRNEVVVKIEETTSQPFDVTRPTQTQFDRPAMKRRPGGLGVYLAKELLDELRFEFDSGVSRIILIKHLGP